MAELGVSNLNQYRLQLAMLNDKQSDSSEVTKDEINESVVKDLSNTVDASSLDILASQNIILAKTSSTTQTDADKMAARAKELGLRATYAKDVYCEIGSRQANGQWSKQKHYIWDSAKGDFVELQSSSGGNVNFIGKDGSADLNDKSKGMVQSVMQGYNFTDTDGVYEKDGKNYQYNAKTNKFEEVKDTTGTQTDADKMAARAKELGLRETYAKDVYCEIGYRQANGQWSKQKHYIWNPAKGDFVELQSSSGGDVNFIDKDGSADLNDKSKGMVQSVMQGYNFTKTDGVYEKNGKNYQYNAKTNKFEEIKDTTSTKADADKMAAKAKELGLRETYAKDVYCEIGSRQANGKWSKQKHYIWNADKGDFVELQSANGGDVNFIGKDGSADLDDKSKGMVQSVFQGYNFTDTDGVYEKDGKNYQYNAKTNKFEEI